LDKGIDFFPQDLSFSEKRNAKNRKEKRPKNKTIFRFIDLAHNWTQSTEAKKGFAIKFHSSTFSQEILQKLKALGGIYQLW